MVRLLQVERSCLCSKSRGEGRLGLFRGLAAPFKSTCHKDTLLKVKNKENLTLPSPSIPQGRRSSAQSSTAHTTTVWSAPIAMTGLPLWSGRFLECWHQGTKRTLRLVSDFMVCYARLGCRHMKTFLILPLFEFWWNSFIYNML